MPRLHRTSALAFREVRRLSIGRILRLLVAAARIPVWLTSLTWKDSLMIAYWARLISRLGLHLAHNTT